MYHCVIRVSEIPARGFHSAPGTRRLDQPTSDLDMETLDLLQEIMAFS
jgi:hypothetical protein